MTVGKKNKKCVLQSPTRVSDGAGYSTDYTDVAVVWAEVMYMKASASAPGDFIESVHATVKIWQRVVAKGWRLVVDGKTFVIKSEYPDGKNTVLNCEEVVP